MVRWLRDMSTMLFLTLTQDWWMAFAKGRHAKGAYLHWIVEHAELIVNIALVCLSIGAILELWEWIRTIRP